MKPKSLSVPQHVKQLIACMGEGVWEKDHLFALSLLAAVAGESIFLLGPPGTGKSLVARRLKEVFADAKAFEYLMSRFSTPDEVFGPVSIGKLREQDCYERHTEGYLPSADVVFLDEIWKAGPAIQNTLLTVLNERIFLNGSRVERLPMKVLIAASNELPKEDEGLEALWDRFLVRAISNCMESEAAFYKMMRQQGEVTVHIPSHLQLTDERLHAWQEAACAVALPDDALKVISAIRKELARLAKGEGVEPLDYYTSDRRWKKAANLMRASAFLNGRTEVDFTDLLLLRHVLWNKAECMEPVMQAVVSALFADVQAAMDALPKKLAGQADGSGTANAGGEAESTYRIYHYFYVRLLPIRATWSAENLFFFLKDYGKLPLEQKVKGIAYADPQLGGQVIRLFDPNAIPPQTDQLQGLRPVSLMRHRESVLVDGVEYRPEMTKASQPMPSVSRMMSGLLMPDKSCRHEEEVQAVRAEFDRRKDLLADHNRNTFVSSLDIKAVKALCKRMDNTLNALEVHVKSMKE